jgi:hypothetical protein
MTWSIVQSNDHENGASSSNTVSVTLGAPVTVGNMVAVFVGYATAANDVTSVTDDQGNNYNLPVFIESGSGGYGWHGVWLSNITNGPTTITSNSTGSHAFSSILAIEVAPPSSSLISLDTSASNSQGAPGTGTDAVTTGNFTTTAADFIIAGVVSESSTTIVNGTGFTAIQTNVGANSFSTEFQVQSAPATQAATFTAGGGGFFNTIAMAFKATFVAPPVPPDVVGMTACEW